MECRASLRPAPDRLLDGGLIVRSAFRHDGAARQLVHDHKYRGSDRAGWILARALAPLVPDGCTIAPIPRVTTRRLQYGIDPAPDLARRLARITGCPVAQVFAAPLLARRQAGRLRSDRQPATLRVSRFPAGPLVLLDDVLTTGHTIEAAQALLPEGAVSAITATASGD